MNKKLPRVYSYEPTGNLGKLRANVIFHDLYHAALYDAVGDGGGRGQSFNRNNMY